MLFRDNLIIRLVSCLSVQEKFKIVNHSSFNFVSDIQLHLSPTVKRIQAHLPGVFKTRVSGYILLREKQKYQVTNVFMRRNCRFRYLNVLFNLQLAKSA